MASPSSRVVWRKSAAAAALSRSQHHVMQRAASSSSSAAASSTTGTFSSSSSSPSPSTFGTNRGVSAQGVDSSSGFLLHQSSRSSLPVSTTARRAWSRSLSSSSSAAGASVPPDLPAELKPFHELGYLDDDGLTVFDTLHDMQVRSCHVFADRPLFGTYSNDSKKFEWMSYHEYAHKVDCCRAFLQSVGA